MLEKRVQDLEENELVETIMMKGSRVQMDSPASSNNIDEIMRSMMASAPSETFQSHQPMDTHPAGTAPHEGEEDIFGRMGKGPVR